MACSGRLRNFQRLEQIAEAQSASDHRLIGFCDGLDAAGPDRMIELKRKERVPPEKVGDVPAHLFVHQIHHRGQAHAMLSGTNVAPPQLDEFFLTGDAPLNADDLKEIGIARR